MSGFAGGAFLLSAPAYTSEIAEKKYSGALGTVFQLMVCCGILFVNVNCSTNWRGKYKNALIISIERFIDSLKHE